MVFADFGGFDVRFGKHGKRHRAAVSQFTSDNRLRTTPPRVVSIERMIDDDPELVVRKIERSLVLIPSAPGIGSNKHDLQDFAGDRSRHTLERSGRTQDARDAFNFLLLSPDEVPNAGHGHLARIDILDKLILLWHLCTSITGSRIPEN